MIVRRKGRIEVGNIYIYTHTHTHTYTHIYVEYTHTCTYMHIHILGFPGGIVVKNLPAIAGDVRDSGSISGSRRSTGVGNGNPLHYSCLENSVDRGAWGTTVHGVAKSWTQLSD